MPHFGKLNNAYLHRHELELKIRSRPFECDRCGEYGLHTRYQCIRQPSCPFNLHKACAEAIRTPRIQHDLFPNCEFELRHRPSAGRVRCDACARPATGFHYHCARRDLNLHPNCARLPTRRVEGGVMLRLRDRVSSECSYCGRRSYGDGRRSWCYVSEGGGEVHLHVGCVTDMLLEAWERQNCTSRSMRMINGRISNSRSVLVPRHTTRPPPKLQVSLGHGGNGRNWRAAGISAMRVLKIVVSVVAAVFGDPTLLVGNLISAVW